MDEADEVDQENEADDDEPTILIVEDEPSLVEIYAHWLEDYTVITAQSGERALSLIDDSVDIMILDRLMPGMSGDEVIDAVRDRGLECMIVMATAVEPDVNLISMGADSNLTKPVRREELRATVATILDRQEYEALEDDFFALIAERATLKANGEDYSAVDEQLETVGETLDGQIETMDDSEFISLIRNAS